MQMEFKNLRELPQVDKLPQTSRLNSKMSSNE